MTLRHIKQNDALCVDDLFCAKWRKNHRDTRGDSGLRLFGREKSAVLAVVFALFVMFVPSLAFVSCSNAVNPPAPVTPIPAEPGQVKMITVSGTMTTASLEEIGVVPSFFGRSANSANSEQGADSRMTMPFVDMTGVTEDDYYVKATYSNMVREGTVELSEDGNNSFQISLEMGYCWTVELGLKMQEAGESAPTTKLIDTYTYPQPLSNSSGPLELKLEPKQNGTGRINLPLEASTLYASYVIAMTGDNSADWNDASVVKGTNSITTSSIKSGTYKIRFDFKDANGLVLYSSDQIINVYDNLTTNKWIDDSDPSPINGDGKFQVTQALIGSYARTNVYVDGENGNNANSGSSIAPVKTLATAFALINAHGVGFESPTQYTIRLLSDVSETVAINSATFQNANANKVVIRGYGENRTITGTNASSARISVSRGANTAEVPPIELRNLTLQNGESGLSASGNVNVTLVNCDISDNSGCGVNAGSGSTITLTNCDIEDNTAEENGGGLYVNGGTVNLTNCDIEDNDAGENGGGIYVGSGTVNLSGCTFDANTAENGGGLYVSGGTVTISGSTTISSGGEVGSNDIYLSSPLTIANNFVMSGSNALLTCGNPSDNKEVLSGNVSNTYNKFTLKNLGYELASSGKLVLLTDLYVSAATSSSASTPAGNNTTGRGTAASPFATVTRAFSLIQDVNVAEDFVIHVNGAINDKLVIQENTFGTNAPTSIKVCGTSATTDKLNGTGQNDPVVKVTTNIPVTLEKLTIQNGTDGGIYLSSTDLEVKNCIVENNTGDKPGFGIYKEGSGVLKITDSTIQNNEGTSSSGICAVYASNVELSGKVVINGNVNAAGTAADLYIMGSGASIIPVTITSALAEHSRIGITTQTAPTAGNPVKFTSGYGYNDGYNNGIIPGTYFFGDVYGVTLDEVSGEVVLALSGGGITPHVDDDVVITCDKTSVAAGTSSDLTFTVKDGTIDITTDVRNSFTFTVRSHGSLVPTTYSTQGTGTNKNKLTFSGNLPADVYTVTATVRYNGMTYSQTCNITVGSGTSSSGGSGGSAPNGFVAVTGATVTGAVGSGDAASSVFIAGRSVTIPNMYVSDHEVTQAEYSAIMGANPSNFNGLSGNEPADGEIQENRPVEKVSWYNALVYCNKKSIAENLTPCYTINGSTNPTNWGTVPTSSNETWNAVTCNFNANGYRLPTEAEWEYIARGGNGLTSTQTTYSGTNSDSDLTNYAWYTTNSGNKTHEVRKKNANSLGIYDMTGNVLEWCWDWSGDITSGTATTGASSGSRRVARGGSWYYYASDCRVAIRSRDTPGGTNNLLGFRVVRTVQ